MKLDEWQEKLLATEGDICAACGRQVGKSTVVAIKAAQFAVNNPGKTVLIIASVERQALLLFEKTLAYLYETYKKELKRGRERPTKHRITLANGSNIFCYPTGLSGYGIRGFTISLLIADEAAFIPEEVWRAVTPMLAITKGKIILLSTPFGKGGYFYERFKDPNFTAFHVSSEECPRRNEDFLKRERDRMTKLQYSQEYLAEFIDELQQFFPTEIIQACMNLDEGYAIPVGDNFLGVDIARMGADDSVLYSVCRIGRDTLWSLDMEMTSKTLLSETAKRIRAADRKHNYKKIYIDSTGMGVGVFDMLLEDDNTKRKVVSIENASRSLDNEEKRTKKLLKEDLYSNLLAIMEQKKIHLFRDPDILLSLKSVQYEYVEGNLKIFGAYTHIAEALVRAAWCMKDKSLNIWIA